MPRTKTDAQTWTAALAFLETLESDELSDRAIARRFKVGHPKIARARAARRRALGAESSTRVEHNFSGHQPSEQVEHRRLRASPEVDFARPARLVDAEHRFSREATEAWVRSFDGTGVPPPHPMRRSAAAQAYADELRETLERTGMVADLSDFLDRRGKP